MPGSACTIQCESAYSLVHYSLLELGFELELKLGLEPGLDLRLELRLEFVSFHEGTSFEEVSSL